ncbi:methyl-accepting chemotaxis protein [Devosia sp.]|uniref:methyl-accepting chemotaxis protein n=1 Tax=Devosia sp. TaxID=1871048 RepID=UPI0035B4A4F0
MKSPDDLSTRLDFIGLDRKSVETLASAKKIVLAHLPVALERFYEKLVKVPEVSKFFSGAPQINRAQNSQLGHWKAIATGQFDDAYVESSRRIGLRHATIGLEPRWYIGGYGLILETLVRGVAHDFMAQRMASEPRPLLNRKRDAQTMQTVDDMADVLTAMMKSVMVDIDMAVSVYFEQVLAEAQKRDRENAEKIQWAADMTGEVLQQLASGDLTGRIESDFEGGFAHIKDDTNALADRLTSIVRQLQTTSRQLKTATGEILAGANDLSERTTRQAAAIEQTSASMEELAKTVTENARLAEGAAIKADSAAASAEAGGAVMAQVSDAMDRISDSSRKISNIIGLIDDIAFQTNLLALNASVEAARAGDAGKGFAVVAVEVRRLAQSAANASFEVKGLVEASVTEVAAGESLVRDASHRLADLLAAVRESTHAMAAISVASREQSLSIGEISAAVLQMDEMTQHNAALVEQTNAAIEQTESQARDLDEIIDQFTLTPAARPASQSNRAAARQAPSPARKAAGQGWSEF